LRIAIVTMLYNERVNLPIWIRHCKAQCPDATLLVIDHGSTDASTQGLRGVNVVTLPRSPCDNEVRVGFMADFQPALLRFYDLFIYTDCDEMLVADPRIHASLQTFLASVPSEVIAPTGLHMLHVPELEPKLDLGAPILGQRRFVEFGAGMCKPTIARLPLRWHPGFHCSDRMPDYRTDLYQFHLATMDMDVSLARLRLTRDEMSWSENSLAKGQGYHKRASDELHLMHSFHRPAAHIKQHGAADFSFESDLERLTASIRLQGGFYLPAYFRGTIAAVPEAFFGLI
jgi:hypothetical protein